VYRAIFAASLFVDGKLVAPMKTFSVRQALARTPTHAIEYCLRKDSGGLFEHWVGE
jgi:hypothetical protein